MARVCRVGLQLGPVGGRSRCHQIAGGNPCIAHDVLSLYVPPASPDFIPAVHDIRRKLGRHFRSAKRGVCRPREWELGCQAGYFGHPGPDTRQALASRRHRLSQPHVLVLQSQSKPFRRPRPVHHEHPWLSAWGCVLIGARRTLHQSS